MSFFAEINDDALTVAPERVASGARTGFLRSFETSYKQQVIGASLFGIQEAMRNREDRQRQRLRDAGVENIPSISQQADDPLRMFTDFGQDYYDAAEFYEQGGDPAIKDRLSEYDYSVFELKRKYPQLDLETSGEMWESVKREAQQYETRGATERPDLGGIVGGFLGGAAGALNPNTDPLNFGTLPFGGAGKTLLSRVAVQAGAQGLVEGGNQLLGVQDQRRLQGLSYGLGDAASRVAGAAIGGAAVQGIGEVAAIGFRKLFRGDPKAPNVPAPEPKPLPAPAREGELPDDPGTVAATYAARPQAYYDFMNEVNPMRGTRAGKARMVDDLTYAETQLNAWDGPTPFMMPPKTDTAPPRSLSEFTRQPNLQDVAFKADVDALARRVDPETFAKYDKLLASVSAPTPGAARYYHGTDAGFTRFADTENGIHFSKNRDAAAGYGKRVVEAELDLRNPAGLDAWRAALDSARGGNPRAMAMRTLKEQGYDGVALADETIVFDTKQVKPVSDQLKALTPLMERAYARARDEWNLGAAERLAVVEMVMAGNQRANFAGSTDRIVKGAIERQQLEDAIPVLAYRPIDMKPDADAADVQMRVYDERDQAAVELADQTTNDAKRLIKQAEAYDELDAAGKRAASEAREPGELPPDQFKLPGYDEPMSLNDRIEVMNEDTGAIETISVRELLQRQVDTDEDLKAVQSCSLR